MTQLESSIIPTRDRAAQDVVNSARPRTYSVARRVVVAPAAVEYKPAVSSRDRGHSSATASHSDAHARRRRCVLPAARIPQQEVGSSERRLDLFFFFLIPHTYFIHQTPPLCCGRPVRSWGNSPPRPWVPLPCCCRCTTEWIVALTQWQKNAAGTRWAHARSWWHQEDWARLGSDRGSVSYSSCAGLS